MLRWVGLMRRSFGLRNCRAAMFAPWMHVIAALAEQVRKNRYGVPDDSAFRTAERKFAAQVTKSIEALRQSRDKVEEETCRRLYG
jgi:hypothetical protein